jgi:hypothetical protein
MADVSGKFFSAKKVRTGVSPSSPGVEQGETLPPVNPPGTSLNSVGLTMPSAFAVANSPLTSNGTIAVTGAGTVAQYVRGDGSLADFPESSGGGSSVSYYLNGSVSQGTIGGVAYLEMNKVPILGAGTDFTRSSNGYIASFITDAGDPNLLEIPGGNWNFESYFSASSGGGSPTFYVELYKVNAGGTATLIASNSANPELISFGTTIAPYFSSLAVPTTVLALTDRLAVRYYVTPGGRTLTLHTEGPHLCQIITTFTTGITALNGLTAQVQNFAVGTTGTDFNIASATATHTFNLPTASATNRGALSAADWTIFNNKENAITAGTTAQYYRGDKTFQTLNTAAVPELTNLYYTDARSRAAISLTTTGASGSSTYNNTTGVLNVPTYTLSGLGGIGGTIAEGRVAFGTAANTIGGDSGLIYDNTNKRLGVGTLTPLGILTSSGTNAAHGTTGIPPIPTLLLFRSTSSASNYAGLVIQTEADGSSFGLYSNQNGALFFHGGTERWRITSAGILQSNGAQTIQTSTGNLTLTSADNTGIVDIRRTDRALGAELRITNAFNGSGWLAGDIIGTINFFSSDTSNPENIRSQIQSLTTDTVGTYATRVALVFKTADLSTLAERWRIGSTGILQSNGTQTIQTSTGNLTLATGGGNGNILLSPNGTGTVTLSNLAGTGTRMVVASLTGVLSTQAITVGTVTSVAALTLGTTGTDLSSTVANSTTTPVITLNVPTASAANRGALSAADWTTFNNKQAALNGTGFVKISGTTISYDNSTYLTTASAASTYLTLTGGTLSGTLNGTVGNFSINVTAQSLTTNRPSLTTSNPFLWTTAGTADWFLGSSPTGISTSDLSLYSYGTSSVVLNIVKSTGAATFFSSVTATSFFESSDATIKTLVKDNYEAKGIELVVAKLYLKNGKKELGYFAQDLENILPSAVSKGTDGLLNLSYREVHTAKIAYLEQKIKQLENELGRFSK